MTLVIACKGSDAPKTPLGAPPAGGNATGGTVPAISGEARVALDSANTLFRAKNYDAALAEYNRAAGLAPTELAPLLGVMMVADITQNTKLADETRPRIRKLDPTYADSAAESHSKIIKSHPPTKPVTPET
jgi:hypothetical protein